MFGVDTDGCDDVDAVEVGRVSEKETSDSGRDSLPSCDKASEGMDSVMSLGVSVTLLPSS